MVNFDLFEEATAGVPGFRKLKAAVDACSQAADRRKDEKAIDFFQRARVVLAAPIIKIMRVADSNTTGLVGPCVEGQP